MTRATRCVVKGPSVIPDRYFVKMKYSDTIFLGGGVLQYASYVLRGNSIYDPDFTGTGHQVMGFDQLCPALYQYFTVFASSVSVRFMNQSSSNPAKVFLFPSNSSVPGTDPLAVEEQAYSKRAYLSLNTAVGSTLINSYMSTKKMFGLSKLPDYALDFTGSSTQNPANVWFWNIFVYGLSSAIPSSSIAVEFKLTYWVEFYNRAQLSTS